MIFEWMTTRSKLEPPRGVETETYIVNEMYVVFLVISDKLE